MAQRQGTVSDAGDEIGFRLRVCLTRRECRRAVPRGEATLEIRVFTSRVAVFTQVVPEDQGTPLLVSARMNDMYMVRVRPRGRAMEKGAEAIVWVR